MKDKEIRPGQSLLDMVLQECGSIDLAFEVAEQNGITVADELTSGLNLKIGSDENNRIVREYRDNAIFPATALEKGLLLEGIGYMGVEIDFIVS